MTVTTTPPATATSAPSPRVAPTAFRATWTGTITFGLVSVGVKTYSATQDNDVSFKQVHSHGDGDEPGFVKYKRICSGCEEEIAYGDIDKAYEATEGLIVLDKNDMASLPLDSAKAIAVQEFVPMSSVDPIMFEKTYYLAPENEANKKAYALLRDGLVDTGRAGVVKVTMRQREQVALLHVRDSGFGVPVLALTTLLWGDEVRHASMPILAKMPETTEAEVAMARMLIESLAKDAFNPDGYEDGYRSALEAVIASKRAGLAPTDAPPPVASTAADNLMAVLIASVEAAKKDRERNL